MQFSQKSNTIFWVYYVRERQRKRENILRKGLRRGSRILLSVLLEPEAIS